MSASKKTKNYNLPQWIGSDNLSILNDVNMAFNKIDTVLKENENNVIKANGQSEGANSLASNANINASNALEQAKQAKQLAENATVNSNAGMAYVGKVIIDTVSDTMDKVIAIYGGKRWRMYVDRAIVGAGGDYSVKEEFGENEHKLSVEEMPEHWHEFPYHSYTFKWDRANTQVGVPVKTDATATAGLGGGNLLYTDQENWYGTARVGGNKAHSIVQKSIAFYIWECVEA